VSALRIEGLSVRLGGVAVLDRVDLSVDEGEWVAVIGPNGSGKTTLLRAIAGLAKGSGTVAVGGAAVGGLSRREVARRVALVPQIPALPAEMPVRDYVLLGRTPHLGAFASERQVDVAATERALRQLDLAGLAGRRLGTLSGGELQRAVLARALAQEAPILLLDEPTSALDIGRQQDVLELVDSLRRDLGLTVLSAMHDLTLAGQYAARLVLLERGRVVVDGPPREVLTRELIAQVYGAEVAILGGETLIVAPARA